MRLLLSLRFSPRFSGARSRRRGRRAPDQSTFFSATLCSYPRNSSSFSGMKTLTNRQHHSSPIDINLQRAACRRAQYCLSTSRGQPSPALGPPLPKFRQSLPKRGQRRPKRGHHSPCLGQDCPRLGRLCLRLGYRCPHLGSNGPREGNGGPRAGKGSPRAGNRGPLFAEGPFSALFGRDAVGGLLGQAGGGEEVGASIDGDAHLLALPARTDRPDAEAI